MRWALLASTGLVLLTGLAALGWLTLPLPLRLTGAFIGLGLLPGCALLGCWRSARFTLCEWIGYGFGLSLALFAPVAVLGLLLEWSTPATAGGCLVGASLLGLLGAWRAVARWEPSAGPALLSWLLVAGLLVVLGTLLIHPPPLTMDGMYSHAQVRKLAEFDTLSPRDSTYREAPPEPIYAYNVWDVFLALVTRAALADAIQAYLFLPLLLSPLLLLATLLQSRALFRDDTIARWCGVSFLLTFGFLEGYWIFQTATYHVIASNLILLQLAVGAAFQAAEGRRGFAALSALCAAAALTVHPISLILYGLALSGTWVASGLARPWERFAARAVADHRRLTRPLFLCLLYTGLLATPYLILKWTVSDVVSSVSDLVQPWHPIQLTDLFYVENPDLFFAPHYYCRQPFSPRPFIILAYAALPILFFVPMARRARLYLIASTSIPLLTGMNPLLFPLIGRLLTFVTAQRFTQLVPAAATEGLLMHHLFRWARKRHPSVLVLLILLLGAGLAVGSRQAREELAWTGPNLSLSLWETGFEVNPYRVEFFREPTRAFPMLEYLREQVREPTVIAADLNAGHLSLGFTRHFVLGTHGQMPSMAVADQAQREALLRAIYGTTPVSEIRDALRRYGVRYILFDRRRSDGIGSPTFAEKFTEREGDGRIVYADAEYLVIELSP